MEHESLQEGIRAKFERVTNAGLIHRIERAEDFGYDDEEYELSRRLKLGGQAWRWVQWGGQNRVYVYPTEGQQVIDLNEEELIGLVLEPGMKEEVYRAARDEYYRRRGEVIDRAIEQRRAE